MGNWSLTWRYSLVLYDTPTISPNLEYKNSTNHLGSLHLFFPSSPLVHPIRVNLTLFYIISIPFSTHSHISSSWLDLWFFWSNAAHRSTVRLLHHGAHIILNHLWGMEIVIIIISWPFWVGVPKKTRAARSVFGLFSFLTPLIKSSCVLVFFIFRICIVIVDASQSIGHFICVRPIRTICKSKKFDWWNVDGENSPYKYSAPRMEHVA